MAAIGIAAGQSQTEEVRVVARSLAGGRIEFGVKRGGERVLPAGRYMGERQISTYDGRWLCSTPVQIEVAQRAASEALSVGALLQGTGDGKRTVRMEQGVHLCFADIGETQSDWALFWGEIKFGNWEIDQYAFRWSDDDGEAHWAASIFEAQQAGDYTFDISTNDGRDWAITSYLAPR